MSNVVAHEEPALLSHFDDLQQQDDSTKLGMWTFLATEVMFFGGMFLAYILWRWKYHTGFAVGRTALYKWLGFTNTGVLLCSSLSMALAVAVIKAALILLFFMHFRDSDHLTWLVGAATVAWFLIMIFLTLNDYNSRDMISAMPGK